MLRRLKAGEFDRRAFPSDPVSGSELESGENAAPLPQEASDPSKKELTPGQSLDDMILEYLASDKD
jgi:hypothetical protein